MFDLDRIRNRKYYFISNFIDVDCSWDEFIKYFDTHPSEHRKIVENKISFNLREMEWRSSTPDFAKKVIVNLKKNFFKNTITCQAFGGFTNLSQSFNIHRDVMDVFYIQVIGSVDWLFYESKFNHINIASAKDKPESLSSENTNFLTSKTLYPGDAVWVPRGTYHLVKPKCSRVGFSFGVEGNPDPSTFI